MELSSSEKSMSIFAVIGTAIVIVALLVLLFIRGRRIKKLENERIYIRDHEIELESNSEESKTKGRFSRRDTIGSEGRSRKGSMVSGSGRSRKGSIESGSGRSRKGSIESGSGRSRKGSIESGSGSYTNDRRPKISRKDTAEGDNANESDEERETKRSRKVSRKGTNTSKSGRSRDYRPSHARKGSESKSVIREAESIVLSSTKLFTESKKD